MALKPYAMYEDVLSAEETDRVYQEGYRARKVLRQEIFHSPYPKAGDGLCSKEDYERGVQWRRGWNDAALEERV